jgi:hypothetical protein
MILNKTAIQNIIPIQKLAVFSQIIRIAKWNYSYS